MLKKLATHQLFKQLDKMESGRLSVTTPDGTTRIFEGRKEGENASITLYDWDVVPNLLKRGDIAFAEDYKNKLWESDNLISLTSLGIANKKALDEVVDGNPFWRCLANLSYIARTNTMKGSRRNIQAHYDLGNDFYELWLDPTMTYSSALYNQGDENLVQAQYNKYDRIIDQLNTPSGSVLEVGCGWGGFGERLMNKGDYNLKGITLSDEQHDYAKNRLGQNANIALEDYRIQEGRYDNIVSIEMFEAVGEKYWATYFGKISQLLKQKGRAVIQTITINDHGFESYRKGSDFIRSFIFPGGMLPSPSRFDIEAQRAGLKTENQHFFGLDYARTLEIWLQNFDAKRDEVLKLGYDEGFIRMWRFYLAACAAGFRTGHTNVMQIELCHA